MENVVRHLTRSRQYSRVAAIVSSSEYCGTQSSKRRIFSLFPTRQAAPDGVEASRAST